MKKMQYAAAFRDVAAGFGRARGGSGPRPSPGATESNQYPLAADGGAVSEPEGGTLKIFAGETMAFPAASRASAVATTLLIDPASHEQGRLADRRNGALPQGLRLCAVS